MDLSEGRFRGKSFSHQDKSLRKITGIPPLCLIPHVWYEQCSLSCSFTMTAALPEMQSTETA